MGTNYQKRAHLLIENTTQFLDGTNLLEKDRDLLVSLLRDYCVYGNKCPFGEKYLFNKLEDTVKE